MKAHLMYTDQDFDLTQALPWNAEDLIQDLELETLFQAMAGDDEFLREVAKRAVLTSLNGDLNTIRYRQDVLKDCLQNTTVVRELYDLAVQTIEQERKAYFGLYSRSPSLMLHRALDILNMFVDMLVKLRGIAEDHAAEFQSDGFSTFFAMIEEEITDEYVATVQEHLKALKFRGGVLISAELGKGNKGVNYTLRKPWEKKQSLLERLFGDRPPSYTLQIPDRDDSGARALSELRDNGINPVSNALAQSAEHILSFFAMLRRELAFYVGCVNLYERLTQLGEPITFPTPLAPDECRHRSTGLYDPCLALTSHQKVMGNDVNARDKDLVIITGANQGGKSTFLRSVGLSQLMMQCGMFVSADSYLGNTCEGLYTHFKREEDETMESGKLDEELSRISDIVAHITPDSMLLLNESFAATNEREGSEIARQIICALLEEDVQVFFVTHLYECARSFLQMEREGSLFLRAQRREDGTRTFKLLEGHPLETSYGADLYKEIFTDERSTAVRERLQL